MSNTLNKLNKLHRLTSEGLHELASLVESIRVIEDTIHYLRTPSFKEKASNRYEVAKDLTGAIRNLETFLKNKPAKFPPAILRRLRALVRATTEAANGADLYEIVKAKREKRKPVLTQISPLGPIGLSKLLRNEVKPQEVVDLLYSHVMTYESNRVKESFIKDVDSKELKSALSKYSKAKSLLPSSLNKSTFKAVAMPIVPLFSDVSVSMNPDILARCGFKVKQFGADGFIVLENEIILAVDRSILTKSKVKDKLNGAQFNRRHNEMINSVNEILADVNEAAGSTHGNYGLVSNAIVPSPSSSKIALLWIASERKRSDLSKALNKTEVRWSFPFNYLSSDEH